ncbi:MAG: hypothetical protein JW854_16460, partial [Actinobacteria bacterium]|nr:hypothetical protein [Actinomycetota bacterium]
KIKNFPENLEVRYVYFEDYESRHRALTAIGEEDIGYTVGFAARGMAVFALGDTNMEAVALRENLYDVLPSIAFIMILAANSRREFEYERKVLDRILEETGGKALGMLGEEPFRDVMVTHLLKVGSLPAHGMCGRTGAFLCAPSTTILTSRLATPMEEIAIENKKKYIATGQLADDGGEGMWGVPFNHYHEIYIENICAWDPTDRESGQGHLDLQEDINRESLRRCRYLSALGAWVEEIGKMSEEDFERISSFSPSELISRGKELAKLHSPYDARIGPLLGDCHIWLRKIRAQLDPNGAGDATPV